MVKAQFFQALLSTDVSLPLEEANVTRPPFSGEVTVLTRY
jgi:hypothetical protein